MFALIAFLLLFSYIRCQNYYTGLETIFKIDQYQTLYINAFEEAKKEANVTVPNIYKKIYGEDVIVEIFNVTQFNMLTKKSGIDKSMEIKNRILSISFKEKMVELIFKFGYYVNIVGEQAFKGTGQLNLYTGNIKLRQKLYNNSISTKIDWDLQTEINEVGGGLFSKIIIKLINSAIDNDVRKRIFTRISTHYIRKSEEYYRKMLKMIPFGIYTKLPENEIILRNKLVSINDSIIHNGKKYFSFGYDTVITEPNGGYSKALIRKSKSLSKNSRLTMTENYEGIICLARSLYSSLVEVKNKMRESVYNLAMFMKDLYGSMPRLIELFSGNSEVIIGCKVDPENDIVVINKNTTQNELLVPYLCVFDDSDSGKRIITASIISQYIESIKPLSFAGELYPSISYESLIKVRFKILDSIVPVANPVEMGNVFTNLTNYTRKELNQYFEDMAISLPFSMEVGDTSVIENTTCIGLTEKK